MIRRPLVASLALVAATACVGSSRTSLDYRLKAANTAQAAASAVGSAQAAVKAAAAGRLPAAYSSVILNEAADDAAAAQATFDSVQPPHAQSDQVRDELDRLLAETSTVLVALRTAVRRGELDRLADIGAPLPELHDKLDAFEKANG